MSALSPCARVASKKAVSRHCNFSASTAQSSDPVIKAERGETLGILGPVLAHLDEQEKVHPALQQSLELGPGAGADGLYPLAAFAEHDRSLSRPLHINDLLDARAAVR